METITFVEKTADQIKVGDTIWYYDDSIVTVTKIKTWPGDQGLIFWHSDGSREVWDFGEHLRVKTV